MACSQTLSGLAKDCLNSLGGIVEAYIANKADVSAITVASGEITGITMNASAKFKTYQFRPGTSSLTSNYVVNAENDNRYVESDLVLVFNRMDTTKRVEVTAIAQAETVAIVKDANGNYWFLGYDEGMVLGAGDGLTGTARGDRNGYSVTLHDVSHEMPYSVKTGTGGVDLSTIIA